MTEMLLCAVVAVTVIEVLVNAAVYRRLSAKEKAAREDEKVQAAMDAEADRRSKEMEEGFDNLMRYSIHGKDGFGGTL